MLIITVTTIIRIERKGTALLTSLLTNYCTSLPQTKAPKLERNIDLSSPKFCY